MKSQNLHIRVSDREKQRLQDVAEIRGLNSISELVRSIGREDQQIEDVSMLIAGAYLAKADLRVGTYLDRLFHTLADSGFIGADAAKTINESIRSRTKELDQ